MENDPLRWHGGIKISMAVAFNDALKGLEHQLHTVSDFYSDRFISYDQDRCTHLGHFTVSHPPR
jgi:hypothetical protein